MYSTLSYRHSKFAYVLLCYFRWVVSSKQVTSQAIIVTHEGSGIWLTARIYMKLFIPRGSLIPGFTSEIARMLPIRDLELPVTRDLRPWVWRFPRQEEEWRCGSTPRYCMRTDKVKLDQCYANDCVCNFRHQGVFARERLCTSGVTVLQY
jgi:hypothetical protein